MKGSGSEYQNRSRFNVRINATGYLDWPSLWLFLVPKALGVHDSLAIELGSVEFLEFRVIYQEEDNVGVSDCFLVVLQLCVVEALETLW